MWVGVGRMGGVVRMERVYKWCARKGFIRSECVLAVNSLKWLTGCWRLFQNFAQLILI